MLLSSICTGGPVEWTPMDHSYDVAVQGDQQRMAMPSDRKELMAELLRRFPGEEEALRTYFRVVEETAAAGGLFFAGKVVTSVLPEWLAGGARSLLGMQHRRTSQQTVTEVLSGLTSNESLRGLLAYHYGVRAFDQLDPSCDICQGIVG